MRIPFIGLSGHGRGRHPPIGSQRAADPTRRKRLIEDILGIDLPVQNEIDRVWPGKEFVVYITKRGPGRTQPSNQAVMSALRLPENPAKIGTSTCVRCCSFTF